MSKKLKLTQQNLTKEEVKKIYNKTYYESNKDKYVERAKVTKCIMCGGSYCYYNKSRHLKTKKCRVAVEKIKNIKDSYV